MPKKAILEEEELDEVEGQMNFDDALTVKIEEKKQGYTGPMVEIYLPKLEDAGNGPKVDQYEHVTIANEVGEKTYRVLRGVRVEVPVPVFVILKERYPEL